MTYQYCKPYLKQRWSDGDLTAEQKRLRKRFDDDRLLLAWNERARQVQCWYMVERPYIVCAFGPEEYQPGLVRSTLERRQRRVEELREWYFEQERLKEARLESKSEHFGHEMALGMDHIMRGRVMA